MTGVGGGGSTGGGADLGIGPQLENLRRDNALANTVHDPGEGEPRIARLAQTPAERAVVSVPRTRHNWLGIAFVIAVILLGIAAAVVSALSRLVFG